jgi:phenylacetyl-CoA:acceptor oxidoreductase
VIRCVEGALRAVPDRAEPRRERSLSAILDAHPQAGAVARLVQLEPHLSVTGAGAREWVPVRPKTDAALLFALLHVVLVEHDWRQVCDVPFLERMTASPYLVGPGGYYLRDPETRKPAVWDLDRERPVPFDDAACTRPALDGAFIAAGIETGPDGATRSVVERVRPAFAHLIEHVRPYTPEWAAEICDVPAETIRRLAGEYLAHARVGATIEARARSTRTGNSSTRGASVLHAG